VKAPADTSEPRARRNGHLALHKSLLELLRTTRGGLSGLSDVLPLTKSAVAGSAEDAPSRSFVLDAKGHVVGVLAVSSGVDPEQTARGVANAKGAKEMLGPDLGNVILEPVAEGSYEGLSYAIWPLRRDLSGRRALAFVQKRIARARLLAWLREATAMSRRPVAGEQIESAYRRPLEALAQDAEMHDGLRNAASTALQRLADGRWKPVSVLEHGDFWLGNVLFPSLWCLRGTHKRGFVLIDWAGARLQGYPFYDLLRLAMSSGLKPSRLRREALAHCAALECEPVDAFSYLAAGLGATGLDLGHFPRDRYRATAKAAYQTLQSALK
jgi:hypothetical protein